MGGETSRLLVEPINKSEIPSILQLLENEQLRMLYIGKEDYVAITNSRVVYIKGDKIQQVSINTIKRIDVQDSEKSYQVSIETIESKILIDICTTHDISSALIAELKGLIQGPKGESPKKNNKGEEPEYIPGYSPKYSQQYLDDKKKEQEDLLLETGRHGTPTSKDKRDKGDSKLTIDIESDGEEIEVESDNEEIENTIPRCILYLLEENGKEYIGKTKNKVTLAARLEKHKKKEGSEWASLHSITKVKEVRYNRSPFEEDAWTLERMAMKGIEKGLRDVRGGRYSRIFLTDKEIENIKASINTALDRCYNCGGQHLVVQCDKGKTIVNDIKESETNKTFITCKCGNSISSISDRDKCWKCYAQTD